jgi:hypothetical protein
MSRVLVEFVRGPLDGVFQGATSGPNGRPAAWRAVTVPPRWDSFLDDAPATPAEIHRYDLTEDAADPCWRYLWKGRTE